MPTSLPAIAYAMAFLGYAAFSLYLLVTGPKNPVRTIVTAAAVVTALWAAVAMLAGLGLIATGLPDFFGGLRDAGWFAVVLSTIRKADRERSFWPFLSIAAFATVAIYLLFLGAQLDLGRILGVPVNESAMGVAEAIVGLVLVENMMRNLPRDQFWSVKHLGIGLAAFFALLLAIRIPAFITGVAQTQLLVTQPLLLTLILPLFAVSAARSKTLELRLSTSRAVIFQTATLIAAGVVLEGAAIAAYYLRTLGGDSGTVLAIVFGFTVSVVTALVLLSGSARSRIRAVVNENFFPYKYDYRVEWTKFIHALSASDDGDMPLRVLRTLAELLDSTGGALWVLRDRWHQYMPVAHWSTSAELAPLKLDDPLVAMFADEERAYVEFLKDGKIAGSPAERISSAWLAVPLRYRGNVIAVAVLNPPRAPRQLNWEDRDLISLVALQLGAYLVQEEMVQALADARQLEEFNKRFAFILHDTKNAIGQLSLLVRNVEQFGHIESFRQDMTATLRHSVEKLQQLLAQLRGESAPASAPRQTPPTPTPVDVTALIERFVAEKRKLGLNVVMEAPVCVFAAIPDKEAFLGVLELVVTNAIDASPEGSSVSVQVRRSDRGAEVKVIDRGPGMSPEFIAGELFRPLRSTKSGGFGIGAYQARELMGQLGGKLDIDSKVGEGTTVSLSIPAAAAGQLAGV